MMKPICEAILMIFALSVPVLAAENVVVTEGTQETVLTGDKNLVKEGNGTYIIKNRNTHTGTTTVKAGTLEVNYAPGGDNFSGLGTGAITVENGATLKLSNTNALGKPGLGADPLNVITVNGGTIHNSVTNNHSNLGNVTLNGGSITAAGGSGDYGGFLFAGSVSATDNASITLNKMTIRSKSVAFNEDSGKFTVAKGKTLTISAADNKTGTIRMNDYDSSTAIVEKLGVGELKINANFTGGGEMKITEGKVTVLTENLNLKTSGSGTLNFASSAFAPHVYTDLSGFTGTIQVNTGGAIVFRNKEHGMSGAQLVTNGKIITFSEDAVAEIGMVSGAGTLRPSNAHHDDYKVIAKVGNDVNYEDHTFTGEIIDQFDNSSGKTWNMGIEKVGSNTWTLTNGNNKYSLGTKITGGTLEIQSGNALGTGDVTLNGGTLKMSGNEMTVANNIIVAADSKITLADNNHTLSGTITGTNKKISLSAPDGKILNIEGDTSGFSGEMNLEQGWYLFRKSATNLKNVAMTGAITAADNNGGVALVSDADETPFQFGMISIAGGQVRPSGSSTAGKTVRLVVGNDTEYENHTSSANFANGNHTMSVEKVGSNTWTLTGTNNSYTGGTTITGGVLEIDNGKALGNGIVTLNGGTLRTITNDVTLENQVATTKDSKIDIADGKKLTLNKGITGTNTVELTGGTLALTNNNSTVNWKLNGNTLEIAAEGDFTKNISGTGTILASGQNILTFSGDLSGFDGTLKANKTALVINTASDMSSMTIENNVANADGKEPGTQLCFVDRGVAVDGKVGMITGSGTIRPSNASGQNLTDIVVEVGNDTDYANHTFSGNILNQNHNFGGGDTIFEMGIRKVGNNTWTLTSNDLSYSGDTVIAGGTLELTSTANLKNSPVTVMNGATLKNAGKIGGGLTIQEGGTLTGDYLGQIRLEKGAQIVMDLTNYTDDSVMEFTDESVIGDDIILTLLGTSSLNEDTTYDLISMAGMSDSALEILGDVINHFELNDPNVDTEWGLAFDKSNGMLQLAFNGSGIPVIPGGEGVPEPTTWVLLLMGASFLGFYARKRK
ncbi:MAG: autotransporter-associated beta strand repeat-containing protein [Planctomycetia bacterium]|nr:autotransporter-associated beta strand repeat-containing protein [Planctomycetia bacterium]